MKTSEFNEFLNTKKIIISDGATGTNLIARGLKAGLTAENWVLDKPEEILNLHKDFIKAGSDIILTSTFGGSEIRLSQSGLEGKSESVNQTAVKLAKDAAKGTSVLVAGSIGPLGEMLEPLGPLKTKKAEAIYAKQASILCKAGVDILVIETQFDMNEAKAAISGVKSTCEQAIICSLSFDRGTRTMMGVSPSSFAKDVNELELSAVGINCGKSLFDNLNALKELSDSTDLPIWFKPNAGLPEINVDGIPVYDVTTSVMAENARDWVNAGASIIGGCCGTTPEHLTAITKVIKTLR